MLKFFVVIKNNNNNINLISKNFMIEISKIIIEHFMKTNNSIDTLWGNRYIIYNLFYNIYENGDMSYKC